MRLENTFSAVLSMSLTASVVILIVCLARLAMKKAPKLYSYLLWGLVLFRLLVPISLPAPVSVIPEKVSSGEMVSNWEAGYVEQVQIYYDDNTEFEAAVSAGRAPVADEEGRSYVVTGNDGVSAPKTVKNAVIPLLSVLWVVGGLAVLLPGVISYIRIKRKTRVVIELRKHIYMGDDVQTPFVMGIFRPKIYLPAALEVSEREYIIAHENHHIRRGDHIFKALGFLALAIHWFNPLVWLAFGLAVRDMEMSCDEAVIRKLGENVRADYSASLLKLATGHGLFNGSPLAFGENDPVGRVRNLSKWKRPALWVVVLCVILCIILAVVLLTNLDGKKTEQKPKVPETTTVPTEETTHDTTGNPIDGLSEKDLYTMEDFSSLVKNESTYEDLINLMPESRQPELLPYFESEISYCDYSAKGGFIRIFFGEDLIMKDIRFYAREGSELYPIKDVSVFSFIVPGKTTIMEVMDTVPHPTYAVPAVSSMLAWMDYAVVDGSKVRIFFDATDRPGIIHSVEVIENDNTQTVKGYPLVFADIGEERTKYFVLGFVTDGKLITTDQFLYSGKKLDYYLENPAEVNSDILPVGTSLAFVNEKWESFRASTTGLYCEGEMMYGDIWVYGKVDVVHYAKGYYLGAPSGVKLYPNSVACRDDGFTMDLNADDQTDSVSWAFSQSELEEELFDYTINIKVGDQEQMIVSHEDFPLVKDDLAIWPIDIEQDGTYELLIYEKSFSRFGSLRIYKLNGTTYEEMFLYICENMP